MKGYLGFPHAEQVFMIKREIEFLRTGTKRDEVVYGLSSLGADRATPERLLELNRGHWEIENRVHYVRDVSFDEDRSRVRTDTGPQLMASIRNLAISILRLVGFRYIPSGVRFFAMRIDLVLRLMGI